MNIFQTLYELVNTYIFGSSVAVGTYQELICIAVAAVGSLFIMSIPFLLVYKIIKML